MSSGKDNKKLISFVTKRERDGTEANMEDLINKISLLPYLIIFDMFDKFDMIIGYISWWSNQQTNRIHISIMSL